MVQCPSMSREANGFQEAAEWAWKGNLGRIRYIQGVNYGARTSIGKVAGPQPIPSTIDYDLWSGPAPVLPLRRQFLHYDWHWQWPYGDGDLGNWGIHILDGCRMAVRQAGLPRRVMALGGRFGYDDDGETPNSQILYFDYEPAPILFELRGLPREKSLLATEWNRNQNQTMDQYCGLRQGTVIHCEGGYVAHNRAFDASGALIREFRPTTPNLYANFIDAVRSRKREALAADILDGHISVSLIHMANISYRVGRTAARGEIQERIGGRKDLAAAFERFRAHLTANDVDLEKIACGPMLTMDPARERFTGEMSEAANRLLAREYRKPFVVPDKV
jgi:hypothetical protein